MMKMATKKKRDRMEDRDNANHQNFEQNESGNQELGGDEGDEDGENDEKQENQEENDDNKKMRNCKNGLSSPSSFHLPHRISPNSLAISNDCSSSPTPISVNTHFAECTDLPSPKSSHHRTYNSTNSTLSIAFVAPLPSSDGWI